MKKIKKEIIIKQNEENLRLKVNRLEETKKFGDPLGELLDFYYEFISSFESEKIQSEIEKIIIEKYSEDVELLKLLEKEKKRYFRIGFSISQL